MKVTRKDIKRTSIVSTIIGLVFFFIFLVIYFTSPLLDYMIVIAFAIAVTPPGVASVLHNIWRTKIERALPEFLRDLSTASKTGMPLQTALEHSAKRNYGPLTIELKMLVANMSWGMNFNDALLEFSKRIDLPTVKKASVLIIEAGRHGGDLSTIFDTTATYVENVNMWTARRKMQTFPYVAIFYFSVVIFLFIIIVVSTMLFTPLGEMEGGTALIKPVFSASTAQRVFLHTALLEALFGGLLAGKINEDSFMGGLKHTAILAIVSGIAFYFFF